MAFIRKVLDQMVVVEAFVGVALAAAASVMALLVFGLHWGLLPSTWELALPIACTVFGALAVAYGFLCMAECCRCPCGAALENGLNNSDGSGHTDGTNGSGGLCGLCGMAMFLLVPSCNIMAMYLAYQISADTVSSNSMVCAIAGAAICYVGTLVSSFTCASTRRVVSAVGGMGSILGGIVMIAVGVHWLSQMRSLSGIASILVLSLREAYL